MSKIRTFKVNTEVFDIPENEVSAFLKDMPKAQEVQSFVADKDTFDIPLAEVESFKKDMPHANPLGEEPSIGNTMLAESSQKPFGTPEAPTVPDNIDFTANTKKASDDSGLDFNNKRALLAVMPTMPVNVLLNRKSREVFYNTYAQKQNVDITKVRDLGERIAANRVLELAQDAIVHGDLETAKNLATSQLKTRRKDAQAILNRLELPQVGSGSYRQPDYTPSTSGFSGKQGFTIEGENANYKDQTTAADKMLPDILQPKEHSYKQITPDTQPTASSKYLSDIAATNRWLPDAYGKYVIDPASEMMKHGVEKMDKADMTVHGLASKMVGLAEVVMGVAGIGTLGGQAFTAGLTRASEVAPEPTKVALWGTNYLAPYLKENYGFSQDQAENAGLTADILTAVILHAGFTKAKGAIQNAKGVASIKGMTPAELDAEAVKVLNSVPKEEFHKIVDESVSAFQKDPAAFKANVEATAEEVSNQAQEARDIQDGIDAHANTPDYEPIPHPESLGSIPEGYDVEYQGRKGTIDRGDDGTWYFNDDATGKAEQIPVKDKFNPQETLNDLGIQILPEVPQEQVAKAMADAERTGWVEHKGKRYFVSLGNPKIEGSYDMVFEQTPDGKLVNRFDSHPDQTFAQNRKLKIANMLLEEQGLPKRESLRMPKQSEPTVVESAAPKPVSEEVAVQETPSAEAAEVVQESPQAEADEIDPLKDVESTAKALEGKDVSKLVKDLEIDSNWDMNGEGDLLDDKSADFRYTQRLLPEWNRASQKGEINPDSELSYDIVKGKFGGVDNKEVVEAKDQNGVVVGVVQLGKGNEIEHIAVAPEFRGKGVSEKLLQKLKENNPKLDLSKTKLRSKGFEKAFGKKIISEAYHKAKADGSNPELVKAVEELLSKPQEDALQVESASSVLQHPQEGVGETENLFGERPSSEGKLFDERADASQRAKALEPYEKAVEEAKAKAEVKESTKGQQEISDTSGKVVSFSHAGQERTGVIVGEENGKYIIESKVGDRTNTYPTAKEKVTILEDKAPEAIKSKAHQAIDRAEEALLNSPLFKDKSGGAERAGIKSEDVVKAIFKGIRAGVDAGVKLSEAITKAMNDVMNHPKFKDWFDGRDIKALHEAVTTQSVATFEKAKLDANKTIKQMVNDSVEPSMSKKEKSELVNNIKIKVAAAGESIKQAYEKGSKEGVDQAKKTLTDELKKAFDKVGQKLSPKQVKAIITKAAKIGRSVKGFNDYIERVINNADYSTELNRGKGLRKAINKATRIKEANKKLGGNNINAMREFTSLDPSKVSNIEEYNDIANRLFNATKKVELNPSKKRYYIPDITNKEVLDYVAKEKELNAKYEQAEVLERYNDLLDRGILKADNSLTPEQMKSLVDAFDPDAHAGLTDAEIEAKLEEVKAKAKDVKDTFVAAVTDQLKDVQDYLNYERPNMTPLQIKNVEALLKLDPSKLSTPDLARAYKQVQNLLNNNSFAGIEELAVTSELQKEIPARRFVARQFQNVKKVLSSARSIDQVMNVIYLFDKAAAEASKVSGINEIRDGFSQAERKASDVFTQIHDMEKKMGSDIKSPENNLKRWAIAYIDSNLGGLPEELKLDFDRKKAEIKNNARKLQEVKEGTKKEREALNKQGEMLQKIYDEHFDGKNSVEEVMNSFDDNNKAIVKKWQESFANEAEHTFETAEHSYGQTNLPIQNNYTPIRTKALKGEPQRPIDALNFRQTGTKAKMAGSKNALTTNPLSEGKVHNLDFDKVMRDVYWETVSDNHTSRGITKVKRLFDTGLADELFGSRENSEVVKRNATTMIRQRRGDTAFMSPEERYVKEKLDYIANRSVQTALHGVFQLPKQYLSVAVRAITGGGGNIVDFVKAARYTDHPVLKENNIGSRGSTKAGLEKQSMAEKLLGENSQSANPITKSIDYIAEQVAKPLEKGDVMVARQSWIMYYMDYLKTEKGIDITKEDWGDLLDKNDKDAAAYAEHKVSTTQNPNDPASMAPMYGAEGLFGKGAMAKFARDILLPYNSFAANMKMQQIADIQKLATKGSRVEGAKSLAGNVLEQVAFNALKVAVIAPLMKAVADEFIKYAGLKDDSTKYSDKMSEGKAKPMGQKIAENSADDILFGGIGTYGKNVSKRAINTLYNLASDKSPESMLWTEKAQDALKHSNEGVLPVYEQGFGEYGLYGSLVESASNLGDVLPYVVGTEKRKFVGTKKGEPVYETVPLTKGEKQAASIIAVVEFGKLTGVSEATISDINSRVKREFDKHIGRTYGKEVQIDVMKKPLSSEYSYLQSGSYDDRAAKFVATYKALEEAERVGFMKGLKKAGKINYNSLNNAIEKIDPAVAKEAKKIFN